MAKSKIEQMQEGVNQPRPQLTDEHRVDFGKRILGSPVSFQKVLLSMEKEDLEWVNKAVSDLKENRRRTTRSELMRVGVALMKEKSPEELCDLIRSLFPLFSSD